MKRHYCILFTLCFFVFVQSTDAQIQYPAVSFGVAGFEESSQNGIQRISSDDLDNEWGYIRLTDLWSFIPVDAPVSAMPEYPDGDLETISTLLGRVEMDFMNWDDVGWFRLWLDVDESLVGLPLAFDIPVQNGAMEIYHNGNLLFDLGNKSVSVKSVSANVHSPKIFSFDRSGMHLIAVRYYNPSADEMLDQGLYAGFRIHLYEANRHVGSVMNFIRSYSLSQYLFSGALLVFGLIHLLLFVFYPSQNQNLYFALFTVSLAGINFLTWESELITNGLTTLTYYKVMIVLRAFALIFFMRFAYALFNPRTPVMFWLISVVVLADVVIKLLFQNSFQVYIFDIALIICSFEVMRLIVAAAMRKARGVFIFGTGITIFILTQAGIVFASHGVLPADITWLGVSGIGVLLVSMSVSLSHNVAHTSRELRSRLEEVKLLSEKNLEQERINREQELSRRLLEADNQRKTKELEEARRLQLSLLPDRIPRIESSTISVKMITATEVGGDYYDFYSCDDGSLVVALGDATGHGLNAGMVVATVRSYFHTLAGEFSLLDMLSKISVGIANMNMKTLFMGLTLIRLNRTDRTAELVAAGMPPMLHFNSKTGKVETVTLKGLPLGSRVKFPYKSRCFEFAENDVLLLMSDGLMEAFSPEKEMFGLDRIAELLKENHQKTPDELIPILLNAFRNWTGNSTPADDITLAIIKGNKI